MTSYQLTVTSLSGDMVCSPFEGKDDFEAFIHAKGFLSGLLHREGNIPTSLVAELRTEATAPVFARCAVSAQDGVLEPSWTFTPRTRSEPLAGRDFSVRDPHDEPPVRVVGPPRTVRKISIAARD